MAEPNSNNDYSTHNTTHQPTNESTQSYSSEQQNQTTSTSSNTHTPGLFRTSSGRETYYPDGHESRVNGAGAGLFCEHDDHQETPGHIPRSSYGLYPSQANHTEQSAEMQNAHGSALLAGNSSHREQEMPLSQVESSSSSNSSTRYGSSSPHNQKRRKSSTPSSASEMHDTMLSRRNTRAEIDDEGRRELQRIFTAQSQKMSKQISIAQPGDPTVDPMSDSFDLSRFLRMFRKYTYPHAL